MTETSTQPVKLWNRNFFLLWQGQFVSQLGSQAFSIAMMFWIKHATGSASLMGMMMTLFMLPAVILGPIGGTFADHYSRRKIIIYSDVLSGIFVLVLAALLFFTPNNTQLILFWLFMISVAVGIIRSFFNPAITASIPDIVPGDKVAGANSLVQSSFQISTFVGQGMGGYLFMLLGAPVLILIDAITYLFSAFSETFITIPQTLPEKSSGLRKKLTQFKKDTVDGFKFAWGNKGMRLVFLMITVLHFFIMPITLLLPFYVEDFLMATPAWYGYILSGFGFGSLVGYVVAGTIKVSGEKRSYIVVVAMVAGTVLLASLSIVTKAIVALVVMLLFGVLNGIININIITVLQTSTAGEMRGRVFGLFMTLTSGLSPIAMGLAGVVADLMGQNIPLIYGICGAILILLTITTALLRPFRHFLAYGLANRQEDDSGVGPQ
jgi:MFS family permease